MDAAPALGDGPVEDGRPLLDPQDVLIAFTDGADDDANGFTDDVVGWDFLDDDNDPFDDVQYGHGTGEARDSTTEADNGGELGTCPNCTSIPLRVGDSFVADESDFAQAVLYAVDNDVRVVQEALGTLNHSSLGRDAVEYAYRHDVAVIASAADEAAQHHNWPSNEPHTIVVNSVTQYDEALTAEPRSYLQFNGCTNFSSKIAVAIPSVSCSSDATGRAAGMAGLIYSAALDRGIRLSANEVRQLMTGTADDVNFAATELSCTPVPADPCTDPNLNSVNPTRLVAPFPATVRYPARKGHDWFYGYGRINMRSALDAVAAERIPPEAEITSPDWYSLADPGQDAPRSSRAQSRARTGGLPVRTRSRPGIHAEQHPGLRTSRRRPLRRQREERFICGGSRQRRHRSAEAALSTNRRRLHGTGVRARGPELERTARTPTPTASRCGCASSPATCAARTGATCSSTATPTCCPASRARCRATARPRPCSPTSTATTATS